MSEEPKWASPPGAKAVSAVVQGDTHCNHWSHQSHSESLETAEEENKRGLKARGREVKSDRVAHIWLTATLTNRWGKHFKGGQYSWASMRSWQGCTVKWLKQIPTETDPIPSCAVALCWRALIENSQSSSQCETEVLIMVEDKKRVPSEYLIWVQTQAKYQSKLPLVASCQNTN